MKPQEALEHLKSVIKKALDSAALTTTIKYTVILIVCICWKDDDVHGNLDCDEIAFVFNKVYGAVSIRVVLESKKHNGIDVLLLMHPVVNILKDATSPLVVLFYRYVHLIIVATAATKVED